MDLIWVIQLALLCKFSAHTHSVFTKLMFLNERFVVGINAMSLHKCPSPLQCHPMDVALKLACVGMTLHFQLDYL